MAYAFPSTPSYTPVSEDTHKAILSQVVELGMQPGYQGARDVPQVYLSYELPDALRDDGKPFMVGKRFTLSLFDKATLYKVVAALLGRPLHENEKPDFRLSDLLGKACYLNIIHRPKADGSGITAIIESAMKLPAGEPAPTPTNPRVYFDYDNPDDATKAALPEWLVKIIDAGKPWTVRPAIQQQEAVAKGLNDDISF